MISLTISELDHSSITDLQYDETGIIKGGQGRLFDTDLLPLLQAVRTLSISEDVLSGNIRDALGKFKFVSLGNGNFISPTISSPPMSFPFPASPPPPSF